MISVFSGSARLRRRPAPQRKRKPAASAAAKLLSDIRGPSVFRTRLLAPRKAHRLRRVLMRSATARRDEGPDVAAHLRDLADKRGGDVARFRARRQENGLQPRRHRAVHPRHLHLVVEVGAVAQPADQDRRPDLAREVDDEVVEGAGLDRDSGLGASGAARSRSAPAGRRPRASAPSTDARRSPRRACRRG